MIASWACGLSLIAITIAIHAIGLVIITLVMGRVRVGVVNRKLRPSYVIPIVVGVIVIDGLLLAALHGLEATIWASTYFWLGAVGSMSDGMLYSLDSITTRGASGLTLLANWRLLGALEAANGMLLFGISTAYVFAVMQVYWPMLSRRA